MLTLPNLPTLSRIFAVPILVFLLWRPSPLDYAITFILYCIVGLTDYFDGYVARTQGLTSRLGQFLDPIADKIMVAAVLVMLISSRKANPMPEIEGIHIVAALIILLREIFVSGLREFLAELHVSVPVTRLAKWKTTMQLVAIAALLIAPALQGAKSGILINLGLSFFWVAAIVTLYTGYDYFRAGLKHLVTD